MVDNIIALSRVSVLAVLWRADFRGVMSKILQRAMPLQTPCHISLQSSLIPPDYSLTICTSDICEQIVNVGFNCSAGEDCASFSLTLNTNGIKGIKHASF